jgi:uncharacterized protein YutE (UPF0331/DUF86 family)
MYDRERIAVIHGNISHYLRDIDELSIGSVADLQDRRNYYALSMVLFSLLDAVITMASEVVAGMDFGIPTTYREIFSMLHREGLIDAEMLTVMSTLVSYRNRLAHEYGEITPDDLLRILSKINQIRVFTDNMVKLARNAP